MWKQDFYNYGVVTFSGSEIKVYSDRWNYTRIFCNRPINDVYWAGGSLIVWLSDGTRRRYVNNMNYEVIR